jgi:hypothetical protein
MPLFRCVQTMILNWRVNHLFQRSARTMRPLKSTLERTLQGISIDEE